MNSTQLFSSKGLTDEYVLELKNQALNFLLSCKNKNGSYSLTPLSDSSPFTDSFAIFLLHLLGKPNSDDVESEELANRLVNKLYDYKIERERSVELAHDKYFMQLFAFVLSALYLLGENEKHPLDDLVILLLPKQMDKHLIKIGSLLGVPQSGNLAMCMAVFSIYARDMLNINTAATLVDDWVALHLDNMNTNGFWGEDKVTHLQFQNGYHQYEIFEYLSIHNKKHDKAVDLVKQIADYRGQYAPYFGGSGCYDYDAVSILTAPNRSLLDDDKNLFITTGNTILSEQNSDGGFSESQWIRPRSIKNIYSNIQHVLSATGKLRKERAKYFIAMQSSKHNRMHTHWTKYSREWSESNLWDTWFRLLTIARIDIALCAENRSRWGFIAFPGIGYHG